MSKSLFPQSRTIGRYTQIAINLGFTSRQMFDKAKQDIGSEAPTAIQLCWWLSQFGPLIKAEPKRKTVETCYCADTRATVRTYKTNGKFSSMVISYDPPSKK